MKLMKVVLGTVLFFGLHLPNALAVSASENLQKRLAHVETLAGDFVQTVYENNEILQELNGEFALARESKLYWETQAPEPSTLIADGETLWYFDPFIEQVTLFDQRQMTESNAMLVLLETQADLEHMQVTQDGLQWHIQGEDETQSLQMTFSEAGVLQSMLIQTGMNQHSTITFSNLIVNPTIENSKFEFTVPDGVMVDDQR